MMETESDFGAMYTRAIDAEERAAELEAQVAELERELDEIKSEEEIHNAILRTENAKLREAAKQYILGGHNIDCELNGYVLVGEEDKDPLECDCGYDELAALLEDK